MGSTWRKVTRALGLNLCVQVPREMLHDDDGGSRPGGSAAGRRASVAASSTTSSPAGSVEASDFRALMPTMSGGLRLSKSGSRSSQVRFSFQPLLFLDDFSIGSFDSGGFM